MFYLDFGLAAGLAALKMGVDIEPDTDPDTVPHTKTPGYVPQYSYQFSTGDGWLPAAPLTVEELPKFVDDMHGNFTEFVRLLEDGYPVFGCEVI